MELEELESSKLIGPQQQDVETVEAWAERNGLTCSMARALGLLGLIPLKRCDQSGFEVTP